MLLSTDYRSESVCLALMCLSLRQAVSEGLRILLSESDLRSRDTIKLAGRFGADEIGRRRCCGEALDTTAPVMAPERVTSDD